MDDARAQRDVLPAQPVGVSRPVVPFVVVPDGRQCVLEKAEVLDEARTLFGVPSHDDPIEVAERLRLEEDRLGHSELADVVEVRGVAQHVELCIRKAQLASEEHRERLHAARVPGRVRVSRVDGRRKCLHGCGRALAEQAVGALEGPVERLERVGAAAELLGALASNCGRLPLRLNDRLPAQDEDGDAADYRRKHRGEIGRLADAEDGESRQHRYADERCDGAESAYREP